jgi:FkbM family methyltransferase
MTYAYLKKLKSVFHSVRSRLYKTPHEKVVADWIAKQGDKTYRLEYRLSDKSTVIDLGGYEGQWASDIYARYLCQIIVFEPMPEFAAKILQRFERNPKIRVVQAAAGNGSGELKMHASADASSAFEVSVSAISVRKVDLLEYLDTINVAEVDLLKLNIEGGEYELLEYLIEANAVSRFRNLQIQFHRCVPNFEQRVAEIRSKLERTHTLSWQFPYVWESWESVNKY